MQSAVRDRIEDLRVSARGAGGPDALVSHLLGKVEDAHAVHVHRGTGGGQEQLARVDFGEMRQQRGGGLPIGRDQRAEVREQRFISDVRERVGVHDSTYHDEN